MYPRPPTLASELMVGVNAGWFVDVIGPMLSSTSLATFATWGRRDSFRNRAGL